MLDTEYQYTQQWFHSSDLETFMPLNTQEKLNILEIGSFEGKSTVWFIQNILNNPESTITCIDPWMNYTQNETSLLTYSEKTQERPYDNVAVKSRFDHNIKLTKRSSQVNVIHGFSHEQLPKLSSQGKSYDIVFIDGNHTSSFVLTDAVMSWHMLNKNGYMIFDDYKWMMHKKDTERPKLAIDNFIHHFQGYLEVIHVGNRMAIRKKH